MEEWAVGFHELAERKLMIFCQQTFCCLSQRIAWRSRATGWHPCSGSMAWAAVARGVHFATCGSSHTTRASPQGALNVSHEEFARPGQPRHDKFIHYAPQAMVEVRMGLRLKRPMVLSLLPLLFLEWSAAYVFRCLELRPCVLLWWQHAASCPAT
jgi:hypothetical protein